MNREQADSALFSFYVCDSNYDYILLSNRIFLFVSSLHLLYFRLLSPEGFKICLAITKQGILFFYLLVYWNMGCFTLFYSGVYGVNIKSSTPDQVKYIASGHVSSNCLFSF